MKPTLLSLVLGLGALTSFPAADSYSWGNVRLDGGGFVSSVLASRSQKDLVYARTDVGGVYRWDAVSARWLPLTDWVAEIDEGLLGIESFALDPQDPAKLYLLAGNADKCYGKTVIMRSSNYGQTFDTTVVTSQFTAHANGMGRQSGEKLAVDPKNSSVLYCGSRNKGLFKSVDAGKSWVQADTIGASANGVNYTAGITFVLFDSTSAKVGNVTSTLFMGVGRTTRNLLVSTDGGENFTEITGGPANLMPLRAALGSGNLYLAYSNGPGPNDVTSGALYKYSISGKTWTNITPAGYTGGMGSIAVDAQNPKHLVTSSLCHWGGQWRHVDKTHGNGDKIFESVDGGATWTLLNTWEDDTGDNANVDANGTAWLSGHAIHWAGSMDIDPFNSKRAWVTSGNGIFRTDNLGASLVIWKSVAQGIEEAVPFAAVSIPGGPLVTAIGDYDGSAYTDITKSAPLFSPQVGTTLSLGYAPLTDRLLRVGAVTTWVNNAEVKTPMAFYSDDNGASWTQTPSAPGIKGSSFLNADGSVMFHRIEKGSSMMRSADMGKTWTAISDLSDGQLQYAPLVADPQDPDILYVLDAQGNFWKSTNAGANFTKGKSVKDEGKGLYQNSNGRMAVEPGVTGHLWIPLDKYEAWTPGGYNRNGLAYTFDGGETFSRIDSSIVQICAAVTLGKAAANASYPTLFIWGAANHGPVGIYRSTDKGATWVRINDDYHQYAGPGNAYLLSGDWNVYGRVYMSSAGRGLIYGNIGALTSAVAAPLKVAYVGSLQQQKQNLLVVSPVSLDATLELYAADGRVLRRYTLPGGSLSLNLQGMHGVLYARLKAQGNLLAQQTLTLP
jgi:hypothetical protein